MITSYKIGAVFAAGVTALSMAMPAQAEMTLAWTDQSPNRGARAEATMWFADELAKRTNGEVKIEVHWGGALLKAKAAAKGIADGAADIGFVIGVYNPGLHPGFLLADQPTEYTDLWALTRAFYELNTTNADLQKEWDDLNLHFVSNVTTGPIQMICKDKAINGIEDFAGTKMRGISVYGKVTKDLGAIPVKTTAYDVYQGLDTGLIDCSMFYTYAVATFKLEEIITDYSQLDWGALMGLGIVMNKDAWEAMSPENQQIVTDLGSEFVDEYAKRLIAANSDVLQMLKDRDSVTVAEFPAEQKAKLLEAGKPYFDDWKAKAEKAGVDAAALSSQYNDLLKKWDDKLKADGYPWAE